MADIPSYLLNYYVPGIRPDATIAATYLLAAYAGAMRRDTVREAFKAAYGMYPHESSMDTFDYLRACREIEDALDKGSVT